MRGSTVFSKYDSPLQRPTVSVPPWITQRFPRDEAPARRKLRTEAVRRDGRLSTEFEICVGKS